MMISSYIIKLMFPILMLLLPPSLLSLVTSLLFLLISFNHSYIIFYLLLLMTTMRVDHLNILERASQLGTKLIVGVSSDELNHKKKEK